MQSNKVKKGNGHKKVEIKKIEKRNQLNVTFAKRRQGLFEKARQLSSLCGVDIAVIVFSPTGKIDSFANPSVDSLINLFDGPCWDVPIEDMDFKDLLRYKDLLQELKRKVDLLAEEMMMGRMSQMDYLFINGIVGGPMDRGFA